MPESHPSFLLMQTPDQRLFAVPLHTVLHLLAAAGSGNDPQLYGQYYSMLENAPHTLGKAVQEALQWEDIAPWAVRIQEASPALSWGQMTMRTAGLEELPAASRTPLRLHADLAARLHAAPAQQAEARIIPIIQDADGK
jgi:hypothetical protein